MIAAGFRSAPRTLRLGERDVHVWLAELHDCDAHWPHLLLPEEYQAAEQLVLADERRRFVGARGVLRHLLGRYLGSSGARLRLARLPSGKPVLKRPGGARPLVFSVSHSESRVAIAFAREEPLGVDIEHVRDVPALARIRQWLTGAEQGPHRALPPAAARRDFFRSWTRREARLKALGLGVATRHSGCASRLAVRDLAVGDGYAGAVCIGRGAPRLACYLLPSSDGVEVRV